MVGENKKRHAPCALRLVSREQKESSMAKGLEGIKVIEVGGAAAMPLAGMMMASWGAEVIHVEPPDRGDMMRVLLKEGAGGWIKPHKINFLWEHVSRYLMHEADSFPNISRPAYGDSVSSLCLLAGLLGALLIRERTGVAQEVVTRAMGPYLLALLVALLIVIIWPQVTLWLPKLLMG
jgi:crotonobetainyl-CoA:carnitine CoA-transferase CaiB-like acyl-CoA transferase